jgi:hypothetical protein
LVGEFSDGVPAAWQCKHLDKLRASEVRDAVAKATYAGAREFYLVYSRVASSQARAEMKTYAGWTLLDRGQLTRMLRELPAQVQRDILEQTWGEDVRRLFIEAPGDAFESLERFAAARRNQTWPRWRAAISNWKRCSRHLIDKVQGSIRWSWCPDPLGGESHGWRLTRC